MTEAEFDNGYWYATELRSFVASLGVPATKLRKDELEAIARRFLRTGEAKGPARRAPDASAVRDIDKGLSLKLPVVNYTSNKETKQFIEREAAKLEPGFKRASGTRYLLNRWREAQIAAGRKITYRDLVKQAIELNRAKKAPLRAEHGRYINFISDFMSANKGAKQKDAVRAWKETKRMDAPKTYTAWANSRRRGN
jgi:hypothetical protein